MIQEDIEKSGWNFSQQITQQGALLIFMAQDDFLNNLFHNCFLKTREIRLLIEGFISKEDKKKLDLLERRILFYFFRKKKLKSNYEEMIDDEEHKKNLREINIARSRHIRLLSKYRYLMASLINKSGFGVSTKDDQSKMF